MHRTAHILLACGMALAATGPAFAAQLTIPDSNSPSAFAAYSARQIEQPWTPGRPQLILQERPIADLIATKLGIAEGSAELFRYHLENAPSEKTMFDGAIDGGGIRLKLSW
jgi:hypothetical protein